MEGSRKEKERGRERERGGDERGISETGGRGEKEGWRGVGKKERERAKKLR